MNRSTVRELLQRTGIHPAKRLGQSFLVDDGVLDDIETIIVRHAPETIVEIGPGLGAVTEVLLRRVRRVIAVEVDRRLADSLVERLGTSEGLEVRNEDVLRVDIAGESDDGPVFVVGSLPYRITAPILKWLIDQRGSLTGALLITQREVAEKIVASPGKGGSALGILVRAYAEVELVRRIGRRSFEPIPEVDSTLWTMSFRTRPRFTADEAVFFRTVRTLYNARRKMIRRALRELVPPDAVPSVLAEARLGGEVRGETLTFDELDRLAVAVGMCAVHGRLRTRGDGAR